MLDLYVAFDQRELDISSRDMTTFSTPLRTFRLTAILMGWTNSFQVMHGDVTFMLQDLILDVTSPYTDDILVKDPKRRYEMGSGGYEVLAENPGVQRFFWEHMQNMQKVVQMIKVYGGMLSAKKSIICAREAELLGYWLTYEGQRPDPNAENHGLASSDMLDKSPGFLGNHGIHADIHS